MLRCYRTRRRISAYLDGALPEGESALVGGHVAVCPGCRGELEGLRRVAQMVRASMAVPAMPEWTGFWQGVRRGIERPRVEPAPRARSGWRPRLVVATAIACAAVATIVLWQIPRVPFTSRADAAISVSSADTDHPRGTVVIYSPPEKDLAIVWVFED